MEDQGPLRGNGESAIQPVLGPRATGTGTASQSSGSLRSGRRGRPWAGMAVVESLDGGQGARKAGPARRGDVPSGVLFEGGRIYTGDPQHPWATALAAWAGRVIAVGDRGDLRASFPGYRRVDLHGSTVLPGFTDSHIHLASFGLSLRRVNLRSSRSLQEAVAAVAEAVTAATPGEWIQGGGWDKNLWPEGRFPCRGDLDGASGGHPVALHSKDGHAVWVNSAALARAGITRATPDPPGGVIVRDPSTGEPTGLLLEEAVQLIAQRIPPPSAELLEQAILDATRAAHEAGITGVHVMEGVDVLAALQRIRERGALHLRVVMMIPEDALDAAIALGIRSGFGDPTLRIGGVKIFADGALGSQTASMLRPYDGQPGNYGVEVKTRHQLEDLVTRAASHGIAVAVHAIGDRANRNVLDAMEAARRLGPWDLRHRIEHVQVLHPDDLPRLARLGVVASMQPIHCVQDRDVAERYWGARCRYAYAFRSLLRCGTHLAFGSDAPVETLSVLEGIHAAVTRRRRGDPASLAWYPEECLTVEEAVGAYTAGPAYAAGEEGLTGKLAPGFLADFVALSQDPFAVEAERIPDLRVVLTVVGGEVVYPEAP